MKLSDVWEDAGALAATGEATMIIGGHEANAAQAAAIAAKLRAMEATVAKTKALVNAIAQENQHECEADRIPVPSLHLARAGVQHPFAWAGCYCAVRMTNASVFSS